MQRLSRHIIALALPVLLLSGCNVFTGFYEAGSSSDPAVLLDDAQIALQQGDTKKAITYLRKAITEDPENVQARATLSTALLDDSDVSVLNVVNIANKVTNNVMENTSSGNFQVAGTTPPGECSFESDNYEQFDPTDMNGFSEIIAARDVLLEVQDLLEDMINVNNPNASISSLRDAGLIDQQIAAAFLNLALVKVILAYTDISQSGGSEFNYYYVNASSGTYVGYCAPDQQTLDNVLAAITCNLDTLKVGIDLLTARATVLGSSDETGDMLEQANDAYDRLIENIDAQCSATTSSSVALASASFIPLSSTL